MSTPKLALSTLAVISILFSAPAFAVAGKFQFVNGEVQVLDAAGKARSAKKGDAVDEGETVSSGSNGFAQIRREDGGFFAVRPETEFKIDTFKYEGKEDGNEKGIFSLVKGSLRAVTGVVGQKHKDNYKINTATATIGIRGSGSDMGHSKELGTAIRTLFGKHSITSRGRTIVTSPGQIALASPDGTLRYVSNFPFSTSTTGGGKNNSGGNQNGGGNQGNNNNGNNGNPSNTGTNEKMGLPLFNDDGELDLTNLTLSGAKIGETVDFLSDPVGTPAPTGSGVAAIGVFQITSEGQTFTYHEQGIDQIDNTEFFAYRDANGNVTGWKVVDSFTDTEQGLTTSYKEVGKAGASGIIQDGVDSSGGVVWGRWAPGWTLGYAEIHRGIAEVFQDKTIGGVAFIYANHLTTDSELGQLSSGGITGTYSLASGNVPTAVNGVASGSINSASAIVNFTTGTISNFSVAGSGGAFGSWSASGSGPIANFRDFGIGLSGTCIGGSGGCAGAGVTIGSGVEVTTRGAITISGVEDDVTRGSLT